MTDVECRNDRCHQIFCSEKSKDPSWMIDFTAETLLRWTIGPISTRSATFYYIGYHKNGKRMCMVYSGFNKHITGKATEVENSSA